MNLDFCTKFGRISGGAPQTISGSPQQREPKSNPCSPLCAKGGADAIGGGIVCMYCRFVDHSK